MPTGERLISTEVLARYTTPQPPEGPRDNRAARRARPVERLRSELHFDAADAALAS